MSQTMQRGATQAKDSYPLPPKACLKHALAIQQRLGQRRSKNHCGSGIGKRLAQSGFWTFLLLLLQLTTCDWSQYEAL